MSAGPARDTSGADAPRSTVALLRVDPALREAVPPDQRAFAERVLVVPGRELGAGEWSPEALVGDSQRPFAAMLLHGLVTQDVILAGRCSSNLFGPGDLFRPWRAADTAVPCDARWSATGGASIAILDERFLATTRRWPQLSSVIYDRLAEQLDVAAVRAAIVGLPRVEERVLALFWQLADRWGVVRPEGVVVELALTHALIGHLVAAQRPTVSLALQALAEAGLLRRGDTGAWTLDHDSVEPLCGRPVPRFSEGAAPFARPIAGAAHASGRPARLRGARPSQLPARALEH